VKKAMQVCAPSGEMLIFFGRKSLRSVKLRIARFAGDKDAREAWKGRVFPSRRRREKTWEV
jgi:hypothetical protein